MKSSTQAFASLLCFALILVGFASKAEGGQKAEAVSTKGLSSPASDADAAAEQVNVDTIKEKYWAQGEQSELGVVQNRAYTKAGKFSLGAFGGIVSTDPFLSVKNLGLDLSYHFSEYVAFSALYWKDFVSPSGALDTLQRQLQQTSGTSDGATTNYNEPRFYTGGEVVGSLLYGKLSVLGKHIIYYDFNVMAGLGVTGTESGNNFTQHIGVGQQVYLSKAFSLRFDYRLMHYQETLLERVITPKLGQPIGTRSNWTNSFVLGVDILFGAPKASSANNQEKSKK